MPSTVPLLPIRDRIKDLNTKAYYLLVALSFVYRTDSESRLLKSAFTLTAVAAVLPIQDYIKSAPWLEGFRAFKVIFLGVALVLTVYTTSPATTRSIDGTCREVVSGLSV
jgi:hypothetical protein